MLIGLGLVTLSGSSFLNLYTSLTCFVSECLPLDVTLLDVTLRYGIYNQADWITIYGEFLVTS